MHSWQAFEDLKAVPVRKYVQKKPSERVVSMRVKCRGLSRGVAIFEAIANGQKNSPLAR